MGNPGKYFIEGFDKSYDQSAQNYQENLRQKQSEEYQTQKEERERQAKLKEQQALNEGRKTNIGLINNPDSSPEQKNKALTDLDETGLLQLGHIQEYNKKNEDKVKNAKSSALVKKLVSGVNLTPEEYGDINNADFTKYKDYQEINKPKIKYDYSKPNVTLVKDSETGEVKGTRKGNPFYLPKHIGSVEGYDANGHKTLEAMYDDGSRKVFTTGITKGDEIEDPEKFNKTLKDFNNNDDKMLKMKEDYAKGKTTGSASPEALKILRDRINTTAYNNEQMLYSMMPKSARKYVDDFYNENKANAKKYNQDYEKALNKPEARNLFINWVKKKFESGEIKDFNDSRIISSWGQFKFGYEPEEPNAK